MYEYFQSDKKTNLDTFICYWYFFFKTEFILFLILMFPFFIDLKALVFDSENDGVEKCFLW